MKSSSCDEWLLPKWPWSGSREQFLHCGLRKFRHSKLSVYRWYTQFDRGQFVYDTWDNGSRLGRVVVECTLFMTHFLRLNLQLHATSLVRTCRIISFCTVAWQLARLLLARRIVRSLGDSWASCNILFCVYSYPLQVLKISWKISASFWGKKLGNFGEKNWRNLVRNGEKNWGNLVKNYFFEQGDFDFVGWAVVPSICGPNLVQISYVWEL